MPRQYTQQLEFDSTGSACIRFFGPICKVFIHYANAKVSMYRMLCAKPAYLNAVCNLCANNVPTSPRMIVAGWDCNAKRWCSYMASGPTFTEIFKQSKAAGVTPAQMEAGEGPDVHLQRIGSKTDVVINTESIGKPRGKPSDIWKPVKVANWDKEVEQKLPELDYPDIADVVVEAAGHSYWRTYTSTSQLEAAFPKNGAAPQQSLYPFAQSQTIYGGANFYPSLSNVGWQGSSAAQIVSGSVGILSISGGNINQAPASPSGYIPELIPPAPSKEPEAAKIQPKKKEGDNPPKMKLAEDRWDLLD